AARAFRAVNALARSPGESLPLLKERLRAAAPLPAKRLERLLVELGAGRYAGRPKAPRELGELGDPAVPALGRRFTNQGPRAARRTRRGGGWRGGSSGWRAR